MQIIPLFNKGIGFGFTVIVNLNEFAHWPESGVNVYSVVAMLFKAGDQEPVMLLLDIIGKGDKTVPAQIGATTVNVGIIIGFTVIVNLYELAHCPIFGVNVYSVVATLFKAGDQVPSMLLFDFIGKGDKTVPAQIGAMRVNVGIIIGFTVIVNLVVVAH
jgi:hypothetical protein